MLCQTFDISKGILVFNRKYPIYKTSLKYRPFLRTDTFSVMHELVLHLTRTLLAQRHNIARAVALNNARYLYRQSQYQPQNNQFAVMQKSIRVPMYENMYPDYVRFKLIHINGTIFFSIGTCSFCAPSMPSD